MQQLKYLEQKPVHENKGEVSSSGKSVWKKFAFSLLYIFTYESRSNNYGRETNSVHSVYILLTPKIYFGH